MRQQTKKEVWYWLIIGIGIILVLTVIYSNKKSLKKQADTVGSSQKSDIQQENKANSSDNQSEDKNQLEKSDGIGGATPQDSYQEDQSGGQIGQAYLLDDVAIVAQGDEDRLKINLLPKNETDLPQWQASQNGSEIDLSLSDTSNYDITTGSTSYTGKMTLAGNKYIKKVIIDTSSGDQITFKIVLDRKRPYQISKATNPLRLAVKIY